MCKDIPVHERVHGSLYFGIDMLRPFNPFGLKQISERGNSIRGNARRAEGSPTQACKSLVTCVNVYESHVTVLPTTVYSTCTFLMSQPCGIIQISSLSLSLSKFLRVKHILVTCGLVTGVETSCHMWRTCKYYAHAHVQFTWSLLPTQSYST